MPKVTSVEPQKNKPHRFNIFLDGEFAFGADEDLVVEHRLVVGKIIEAGELEKILFDAEIGKLMGKMYRLFNIRQRSEKEVRDYFRIKNYELRIKGKEQHGELVVNATVNTLKKKGLIDDERFARDWMQARSKKYGPLRIKQELFKKGINREIIEEVISSGFMSHDQEVPQKLLEKKMKVWKNLPYLELKKKAYEYLLRRGFEYSIVKETVEKYTKKR